MEEGPEWRKAEMYVGGEGTGQGLGKGRLRPGDHDSSFTTFIILS